MSLSDRAFRPRNRRPRTSSSLPSGYTLYTSPGALPGWPPACAELPSSRRTSSNEADDGKSILRTIAPYGLLRCLHISISFFLRSATGTVSVARTKRLLMAAPFAPKLPGKRALPLEPANPGAGCRVSRTVFSTPFSTSDSGRGKGRAEDFSAHALFHLRQRPGSHAFAIHFVAAEKWTAVPFFLRRVVHHVEPFRQNTRALAALQLAHRREAVAARFHHGPPRQSQVAAQNFGEELGAGRAFK